MRTAIKMLFEWIALFFKGERMFLRKSVKLLVFLFFLMLSLSVFLGTVFAGETANLAGYGFAKADSYENENSIPLAAVDGVVDRYRWRPMKSVRLDKEKGVYTSTSGRNSWFQVEFEIPTEIVSAKIYWSRERAALDYYVFQYSDDGENWTPIDNVSKQRSNGNGSPEKPYIDEIAFPNPIKAKYFRIELLAGETQDGLGAFYELELHGDPAQYDYLKKTRNDNNTGEEDENKNESPKAGGLSTVEYIAIGIGVAVVIVTVLVVMQLSRKGDGRNA